MKTILLLLFIAAITATQHAAAQTASADSAQTIETAKSDAHRFKLNNENLKKFRTEHYPATSDHFKPSAMEAPNTALLDDSLYVQTFRTAAYYRALNYRTPPRLYEAATLNNGGAAGFGTSAHTAANQQTAQNDARQFTLTRDMLKRFKKAPFPATSDYFTPTSAVASNPALLTDSAYVKTFRFEAFYKTYHQRVHPVGHAFLIGGIIAVGLTLIVIAAAIITISAAISGL